jgi:hypothetical protein
MKQVKIINLLSFSINLNYIKFKVNVGTFIYRSPEIEGYY